MNYLWEAVFMADGQGIPRERIRFLAAKDYSAYMEVSHMFLNQDAFDDDCRLEVNPYYRFYDIFKELYQPEMREFLSLRESLTNQRGILQETSVSGFEKWCFWRGGGRSGRSL